MVPPALQLQEIVMDGQVSDVETPRCPIGLFNFPPGSVYVHDADEEILELYMNLASTTESASPDVGGLGFLDSSKAVLDLEMVLRPPDVVAPPRGASAGSGEERKAAGRSGRSTGRAANKAFGEREKKGRDKEVRVQVSVMQDLSALKGRKGDTGSVLWRSSLHLANHLLTQHHFPPSVQPFIDPSASNLTALHADPSPLPVLLDPEKLRSTRILELGAGTGLLALLLAPLCGSYTASDRLENLQLVLRNLALNKVAADARGAAKDALDSHGHADGNRLKERGQGVEKKGMKGRNKDKAMPGGSIGSGLAEMDKAVRLEEIDWIEVSQTRERQRQRALLSPKSPNATLSPRSALSPRGQSSAPSSDFSLLGPNARLGAIEDDSSPEYDVILAVDCIYNENLVKPLVDTLAAYTPRGGKTLVWVVVELRSSDVLTLFLDTWLNHDSGPWTIIRLGPDAMGKWDGEKPRWVGWVGWR